MMRGFIVSDFEASFFPLRFLHLRLTSSRSRTAQVPGRLLRHYSQEARIRRLQVQGVQVHRSRERTQGVHGHARRQAGGWLRQGVHSGCR
jgi:hypothetical protein